MQRRCQGGELQVMVSKGPVRGTTVSSVNPLDAGVQICDRELFCEVFRQMPSRVAPSASTRLIHRNRQEERLAP
jgi:hypothetical protein